MHNNELIDQVIALEMIKISEYEGIVKGLRFQSAQINSEVDRIQEDINRARRTIDTYTNMKEGELK